MQFGTTFSHLHAEWLGLNAKATLTQATQFGFAYIRLCCYWKEIEKERGIFDFSVIESLLKICEQKKQKVVLTVGMKAPRWPEFHLPSWITLDDPQLHIFTLRFVAHTVAKLKQYTCISYWQVENEPLEPLISNFRKVPYPILLSEIAVVQTLDSRPIICTLLTNSRLLFHPERKLLPIVDVLGLDVYYKIPVKGIFFIGLLNNIRNLQRLIKQATVPVWVMEIQAEPWEEKNIFSGRPLRAEMNPSVLTDYTEKSIQLGADTLFFWGFEYWLAQKLRGESSLWDEAKRLMKKYRSRVKYSRSSSLQRRA